MRLRRGRTGLVVGLAILLASSSANIGIGQAAGFVRPSQGGGLSQSDISRLRRNAHDHVMIIFRNQYSNYAPTSQARVNALVSSQTPVVGELGQVGAGAIHSFHLINAVSATVSTAEASRLSANPAVSEVLPDSLLTEPRVVQSAAIDSPAASRSSAHNAGPLLPAPSCAPGVTLEPEALQRIRAAYQTPGIPQAQQLATGTGVKVGYIADGVDIHNPDFQRANGSPVFADYQDFTGDGPGAPTAGGEAFLDASSIAAQGRQVYDLNSTALFPASRPCNIRILGVAPDASLYGYDVFGTNHTTTTSNFVQAIEYAVTVDHVDVLNESFGGNPFPDTALDAVRLADDTAVAAGVTVTVSTGDSSFANTIGSPSSDPNVIAVGASTQFRSYQQTGSNAFQLGSGGYLSDNISSISSGGFTQQGPRTVDLVAPGDSDFALCTPTSLYADCLGFNGAPSPFEYTGGTSESAPLTAGAAALVIQAYRQTHRNQSPTPSLVKSILMSTARDLGFPSNEQGSGLIDTYRAVQAALAYPGGNGAPQPQADSVVVDNTAFSATGLPNTPENYTFTVTNVGRSLRPIIPRLRSLSRTVSSQTFTVNHQPLRAPQFYDEIGTLRAYSEQDFFVTPSADDLSAAIAWNIAQQPGTLVRLTLFDPLGRYAAYSLPQGEDGYGRVEVQSPLPGRWRAILWSPASATAYAGPVQLTVDQLAFTTSGIGAGTFTPAFARVGPGQNATFTLHVSTPAQAGDQSDAVELDTGSGEYGSLGNLTSRAGLFGSGRFGGAPDWLNVPPVQQSACGVLPVSLRSQIPLSYAGGAFAGTLVGGNGRSGFGSGLNYNFQVPAGQSEMSLSFQTADPNNVVSGYLIDPTGQVQDIQTNVTGQVPNTGALQFSNTMQFFQQHPLPGLWQFSIAVGDISGTQVNQPFLANIQFNQILASAPSLPNGPGGFVSKTSGATIAVGVTNVGLATEQFFGDPRLPTSADLLMGAPPATVPLASYPGPEFFIPTETSALSFYAESASPFSFDASPYYGDPDPYVEAATQDPSNGNLYDAALQLSAPQITPGLWTMVPSQIGPYPPGGATSSTVNFVADAYGLDFDPDVTTAGGDLWNPFTPPATPLTLAPGQSGIINVTIVPGGVVGSRHSGTLFIDTFNPNTAFGDEAAALPYSYTVAP